MKITLKALLNAALIAALIVMIVLFSSGQESHFIYTDF